MFKNTKRWLSLLMMAFVLGGGIFLTSCSADDDDDDPQVTYKYVNGDNYFSFTSTKSKITSSGTWTLHLSSFDHSSLWTPKTYSVADSKSTQSIGGTDTEVYAVTLNYTMIATSAEANMTGYLSTDEKTFYYGHGSLTAYTLSE